MLSDRWCLSQCWPESVSLYVGVKNNGSEKWLCEKPRYFFVKIARNALLMSFLLSVTSGPDCLF